MATKNSSFSRQRVTKALSGSDTFGLKQIDSRPLISPRVDLAEHLVGVDAGPGQLRLVDAPDAGDVARGARGC